MMIKCRGNLHENLMFPDNIEEWKPTKIEGDENRKDRDNVYRGIGAMRRIVDEIATNRETMYDGEDYRLCGII